MSETPSSEYERFEALTRRLAKVPKKEVDDLEESESSKTDPSDKPSDDASEDSEGEEHTGYQD